MHLFIIDEFEYKTIVFINNQKATLLTYKELIKTALNIFSLKTNRYIH